MERDQRRWTYFSKEEIEAMAAKATPESYTKYYWPEEGSLFKYTDWLAGKKLSFIFKDGLKLDYSFTEKHKLLAEASGVASLAALKKLNLENKKIVSIISGGNIDMVTISALINSGLVSRGRLFCFSVELPDTPGQLLEISRILTSVRANVIQLEHNQFKAIDRLKNVLLEVTVETNGHSHIEMIKNELSRNGYVINHVY